MMWAIRRRLISVRVLKGSSDRGATISRRAREPFEGSERTVHGIGDAGLGGGLLQALALVGVFQEAKGDALDVVAVQRRGDGQRGLHALLDSMRLIARDRN